MIPKLGEQITSNCILERKLINVRHPEGFNIRRKEWHVKELKKDITGIIIGKRTLSNGKTIWNYEGGYEYEPTEFLFALLIVTHISKKPIIIPYHKWTEKIGKLNTN